MIQAGLACDGVDSFDAEALNKFTKDLFQDILKEIWKTPNHHCYTTFDVDLAEGTKQAIERHLKKVYYE
jgi:hypothetical protein